MPQNLLRTPQFIVSVALLSLTLGCSQFIEFRERVPLARSFDSFPLHVQKWSGAKQLMEQEIYDALDLSDYVMVDYQDPANRSVNFYVAYYETQRKGESIHTPATCLRGGGWVFKEAGKASVSLAGGGSMAVNRSLIEKGPVKQLAYYWFPVRGRILTNVYQLKLATFWGALTQQRTDGALVRVIVYVYPDETIGDAEKRLQSFVRAVVPILSEYLPS